jgi:hypothetical protein
MTSQHVQSLRTARDSMVAVRRRLAGQLGSSYMQPAEYAANFAAVQGGIEAIDRAIADEESERAMPCGKLVTGQNASTSALTRSPVRSAAEAH